MKILAIQSNWKKIPATTKDCKKLEKYNKNIVLNITFVKQKYKKKTSLHF